MIITSRKNEKVQHLKKLGYDSSYRSECGEMLCDGVKLLKEAISSHMHICDVFVSGELDFDIPQCDNFYETERDIIEYISQQKTPQNVIFSIKIPEFGESDSIINSIVLENIQDPGNVGTVLRTANAFNISQVILVGECADPYSPKTIRASMGAVFKKRIIRMSVRELISHKGDASLLAAALSDNAEDIRNVSLTNCAVCIGNEGNGLTKELIDACDKSIIIPMTPQCESLNASVAAGVIMWEMAKHHF